MWITAYGIPCRMPDLEFPWPIVKRDSLLLKSIADHPFYFRTEERYLLLRTLSLPQAVFEDPATISPTPTFDPAPTSSEPFSGLHLLSTTDVPIR